MRMLAGADIERGREHVVHFTDDRRRDDLARAGWNGVVENLAVLGFDAGDDIGDDADAAIGEGDIALRQFEQRDFLGAERNGRQRLQIGGNAHALGGFDHLFGPDDHGELGRDRVARKGERLAQGDLAHELAVGIVGLPAIDVDRRILGHGVGGVAGLHRRHVNEGLEGRARLAPRGDGAVVLALGIVGTADNGAHRTVSIEGDERTLAELVFLALVGHRFLDQEFGLLLQIPVDGGVDDDVFLEVADIGLDELLDPVGDIGFRTGDLGRNLLGGVDRCGGGFLVADEALVGHGVEHEALAGFDALRIALGIEHGGRLHRAGEHGGFAQRQVARRLAEIGLRRSLDAG